VVSPFRTPAEVRSAAEAALGAKAFSSEFARLSWAGTVWRLAGESDAVYSGRTVSTARQQYQAAIDR
jgi:hypothetical protein